MKITKLEYTSRKDRVNIYLDHKYAFTCFEKFIIDFGLYKGLDIESELVGTIHSLDLSEKIFQTGLKKASSQICSKYQIQLFLINKYRKSDQSKDIDSLSDIVKEAVSKIEKLGIVDDLKYANLIADRLKIKKSPIQITQYLLSKGISRQIIENTLKQIEVDIKPSIESIVQKKLKMLSNKNLSKNDLRNKIYQCLGQRGYKYSDFSKIVDASLDF